MPIRGTQSPQSCPGRGLRAIVAVLISVNHPLAYLTESIEVGRLANMFRCGVEQVARERAKSILGDPRTSSGSCGPGGWCVHKVTSKRWSA